ncbi:hypothetical protein KC349_g252 [Hortaea werneckii]|nr:hypothetical protein KC349_g252 [Hortaea werneckii]
MCRLPSLRHSEETACLGLATSLLFKGIARGENGSRRVASYAVNSAPNITDHRALPASSRDAVVEKPVVGLKRRDKLVNLQSPRPTSSSNSGDLVVGVPRGIQTVHENLAKSTGRTNSCRAL